MHTHHKILWTMALLACGSSLTPVKGTQNNLTESVQAVSSKVGAIAADSDIAKTIGAQASILLSDADLTTAVTAVQGAVGGVVASDVVTNVSTSTKALQAGETVLATAVAGVKDAVGGVVESDVVTNVNTSTTALQAGGTVLATAVTAVQGAIGNVTGGEADDVYKQLTNTESGKFGAIKKIKLDATTLAEAITSLINAVGPITTDIVTAIESQRDLLSKLTEGTMNT